MKKLVFFSMMAVIATSCLNSEVKSTQKKVEHVGDKWIITSVDYDIVDQNFTKPSQTVKSGTATNAGAFYFNGDQGSYDILVSSYHKEDVFGYEENLPDVTLNSIDQSVGGLSFSQSVIAFTGSKDVDTMTIQGTITEQSTTSQFVLTGTFVLTKE